MIDVNAPFDGSVRVALLVDLDGTIFVAAELRHATVGLTNQ